MTTSEKVAYLKGFADGLGLDKENKQDKLIAAIIDVLDTVASDLDELEETTYDLGAEIDAVSDDLADVEAAVFEDDDEVETIRLVTTLRQNALEGLISKESPVGKAVMGHRAGETVHVQVNEDVGYDIVIRSVEKGQDDDSLPISAY